MLVLAIIIGISLSGTALAWALVRLADKQDRELEDD